jgi:two-component system nitrogen regulation sensor histidine kinase GlnL
MALCIPTAGSAHLQVMDQTKLHTKLIDNLSTALLVLDLDLRLVLINSAAQALLELSESRALGSHFAELFPGALGFVQTGEHGSLPDSPFTHRGITLSIGGGHEISVDCTVTPLIDSERAVEGVIVEIHPIDRVLRINREEGLIASQESARALMRGLAHEIKNPLGGLRGAAQLLARELPDPALEEYTRIIIAESDRLRNLVDRMLGPHQQPQMAQLNVHEILEHARALLQVEVAGEVEFTRDYDPSLPDLTGDRSQLIQAVLNIVRNAVEATAHLETGRRVDIRTRAQRQFTIGTRRHRLVCRIDVIDNGPGIAEALRDSLFVPMVSGRSQGSGLGLAISQSIISRHRGLIEFRSEPGRTEFTIYLPMDCEDAES